MELGDGPAIIQLIPYILQICIAHILHAKDKDVLVPVDAVLDLAKEPFVVFPARLLWGFGEGDDLVALAAGHCGY